MRLHACSVHTAEVLGPPCSAYSRAALVQAAGSAQRASVLLTERRSAARRSLCPTTATMLQGRRCARLCSHAAPWHT